MGKIFLILAAILSIASLSFGDTTCPLYEGKEYPVQFVILDKLRALSVHIDDLNNDIEQSSLSNNWANELSSGMSRNLDQTLSLLLLEEVHSESKQFNIRAIGQISLRLIGVQIFFKDIPESCNKLTGSPLATPADVLYLDKIKNISREASDLLQEIKVELAEFK